MIMTTREYLIGQALTGYLSNPYLMKAVQIKAKEEGHTWDVELALNIEETVEAIMKHTSCGKEHCTVGAGLKRLKELWNK